MQTVIIVIHLMVVTAMIGVVLLQKSEGGGLGIGSTGGFLSSRGTSNVLTRTTAILAATFFATSLVLSILAGLDRKPRSIIQNTGTPPPPCVSRNNRRRLRHRVRKCRGRNKWDVGGRATGPFALESDAAEWRIENSHQGI